MMMPPPRVKLPIDSVLPEITEALAKSNALVLEAPPGAGEVRQRDLSGFQTRQLAGHGNLAKVE